MLVRRSNVEKVKTCCDDSFKQSGCFEVVESPKVVSSTRYERSLDSKEIQGA
jgi:hypothetical protein